MDLGHEALVDASVVLWPHWAITPRLDKPRQNQKSGQMIETKLPVASTTQSQQIPCFQHFQKYHSSLDYFIICTWNSTGYTQLGTLPVAAYVYCNDAAQNWGDTRMGPRTHKAKRDWPQLKLHWPHDHMTSISPYSDWCLKWHLEFPGVGSEPVSSSAQYVWLFSFLQCIVMLVDSHILRRMGERLTV